MPESTDDDDLKKLFPNMRRVPAEDDGHNPRDSMAAGLEAAMGSIMPMLDGMKQKEDEAKMPLKAVLERLLNAAGAELGAGQIPAVECQVWFDGGKDDAISGALRRADEPGVYIIGIPSFERGGQPRPGEMVEISFHVSTIKRIAVRVKVQEPKIVLVGDPNKKLITQQF